MGLIGDVIFLFGEEIRCRCMNLNARNAGSFMRRFSRSINARAKSGVRIAVGRPEKYFLLDTGV